MGRQTPRLGLLDLGHHLAHTHGALGGTHGGISGGGLLGCLFLVGDLLDGGVHCSKQWW